MTLRDDIAGCLPCSLQALELTNEQLSLLKAAWLKTSADRSALLQQHSKLAARLLQLQQASELQRQHFACGMQAAFQQHYGYYSEPCAALWLQQQEQQQQWQQSGLQECYLNAPDGIDASAAAAMPVEGLLFGHASENSRVWRTAGMQQLVWSCSNAGSYSTVLTEAAACALGSSQQAAAAVAVPAPTDSKLAGKQQTCSSPCSQDSSVSGSTSWQDKSTAAETAAAAAATAPAACHYSTDPALVLELGNKEQQQLEKQMQKLLNAASLLYFTQHLLMYNVLSRKQLAAAAVAAWPFQFDPMALCEALEDLGWTV
jgi:hypothetical protein